MGYTVDEIKKRVMPVAQKHHISEIYLFGSHARGDATEASDVDLAIDSTPLRGLLQLLAFREDVMDALACPVDVLTLSTMQIGELTTHLSDEFKRSTSCEVPWNLIKAMRNHYAHGYSFMDSKEIFETATTDIPGLREKCIKLLAQLS